MKPKKLAQLECACYLSDAKCLGVDVWNRPLWNKSTVRMVCPECKEIKHMSVKENINQLCPKCGLYYEISDHEIQCRHGISCDVNDNRCYYFEDILIPLVKMSKGRPQLKGLQKAVVWYEKKFLNQKLQRHCKRCHKPVPGLKPNEKYCPGCKTERILASKRRYNNRNRKK